MPKLKKYLSEELQINLSPEQEKQFQEYSDFLQEYNSHTNLTRIAPEDIELLHFFDSLSAAKFVDFTKFNNLIDVGTGAGFPGVPLKIVYPHLQVTLIDSRLKKVNFLKELIEKLGLSGFEAIHARAEELNKDKKYKQKFDLVTARAVADVRDLTKLLEPVVSTKGKILLYKGPKAEEELEQAKKIIATKGLKLEKIHDFLLPEKKQQRILIVITKNQ